MLIRRADLDIMESWSPLWILTQNLSAGAAGVTMRTILVGVWQRLAKNGPFALMSDPT
jgi:hypothetical protein